MSIHDIRPRQLMADLVAQIADLEVQAARQQDIGDTFAAYADQHRSHAARLQRQADEIRATL